MDKSTCFVHLNYGSNNCDRAFIYSGLIFQINFHNIIKLIKSIQWHNGFLFHLKILKN